MRNETAQKLLNLRQLPHFQALVEYLDGEIKKALGDLASEPSIDRIRLLQGRIQAVQDILKDFDQLELLVQNRDNSSESPGK